MKKPTGNGRPALARKAEVIVKELPDEVLVYDLKRDKAHCLNLTASFVWNHCDGHKSAQEIAKLMEKEWHTPVSEDVVWFALSKLSKAELLEGRVLLPEAKTGMTRRSAVRRLAFGSLMVPAVLSLVAPTAMAGSSIPPPCQACVKKVDGGALCTSTCQGISGTCYSNAGCGVGQECVCTDCATCFGGPIPGTKCVDDSVAWKAPGVLC